MPTFAKRPSKKKLTQTQPIADRLPGVEHFDVVADVNRGNRRSVRPGEGAKARKRLAEKGVGPEAVEEAIAVARHRRS